MIIQQNFLFNFDEMIKFQPQIKLELILSQLDLNNIIFNLQKNITLVLRNLTAFSFNIYNIKY